jgi:microcystin-dependent protein
VTPGLTVMVEEGTANGDSLWHLTTNAPITLGTTALTFKMLAGRTGIAAGTYKSLTVDEYGRATAGENPATLAGFGIKDTYTKTEIEGMIANASMLPVGTIVAFPGAIPPVGFLELDSSVKSAALYPDLNTYLAGKYNKGDEGAGNFRLPDGRGEFLRGWDHGRGVDAGRGIGTYQAEAFAAHNHRYFDGTAATFDPAGNWQAGNINGAAASISVGAFLSAVDSGSTMQMVNAQNTVNTGGTETRPRNLAVMWCIKAWNAPVNQGNIDIAALAVLALQANEIKQGTAKVATQEQTDAGVDDNTIVTPKKLRWGFQISKNINGYIVFPSWLGGLIIQWGRVSGNGGTDIATAYPIAFPNAMYSLNATLNYTPGSAVNGYVDVGVSSLTAFYGKHTFPGVTVFHWVAVGS